MITDAIFFSSRYIEDDDIQAVATLFVKTLATPTNLQALLSNIDADNKKGIYPDTSYFGNMKGYFRCNIMMMVRGLFDKLDFDYLSMKLDSEGQCFSIDLLDAYRKTLCGEVIKEDTRKTLCHLHGR